MRQRSTRESWARAVAVAFAVGWVSLAGAMNHAATTEAAQGVVPERELALGAALRAALDRCVSDPTGAADRLDVLYREEPELRDLLALTFARAWLAAGEVERADSTAARGLAAGPSARLRAPLEETRARAAVARGDEPAARAAWQRALRAARSGAERARYRLAIAESHERSDEAAAAVALYRELWITAPKTPEADVAAARLDVLEAEPGMPTRSAADALQRGDRLFDARRNGAALVAYERAVRGPLSRREARHAEMRRALTLFRTRRYREAVAAFTAIEGQEATYWRARSLARAGRVEDAIDIFETIGRTPNARRANWSRYLAAILHEGRDRHAAAAAHYEPLLRIGGELGRNARWRLAWRAYLEGRHETARAHFTRLAKQSGDAIERLRPRYWAARSLETGDRNRARAELLAIAREFPLTYYAFQARQVLEVDEIAPLPNRVDADPAELSDAALRRARVAVAAGEDDVARLLLRELRPRAKRIRDRLALAQLYVAAGDSYPALQLIVVPYSGILARGIDPELPELWEVAWPRPFGDLVRGSLPEGLEASVVWSVMREESGFRPTVESMTGAIGLLQIQPTTGSRLARELGVDPFAARDLAEPATNVRLGAYYLDQLAGRFEGRLAPAIASYNAGADAVGSWIEGGADPDSDVWIESIPYSQTRAYVKRVLRSLVLYRALEAAGAPPSETAPEVAPAALENAHKPALRAADTTGNDTAGPPVALPPHDADPAPHR